MPPDRVQPPASSHSHTLDRGLRALELLAEHADGLSVSELAAALDTHRAAVYRLAGPLSEHRLIRREPDGRFALGPGLIGLAASVRPRLYEAAEPLLQALADELGATTALTLRDGTEAVVARVLVPRTQDIHLSYRQGMRHPLTRGAPGHVLLAAAAPADGDPAAVVRARSQGYAISRGELLPGATGVAAAIPVAGGLPEASISAVWIEGLDPVTVATTVVATANEIGGQLRS